MSSVRLTSDPAAANKTAYWANPMTKKWMNQRISGAVTPSAGSLAVAALGALSAKSRPTAPPATAAVPIQTASCTNPVAVAARTFATSSWAGSSVATSSSAMRLVFSSTTDMTIDCALSRIAR